MKKFKFKPSFLTLLKAGIIQTNSPLYVGSIVDPTSINQILTQVVRNGASVSGSQVFATSAAASATLTNLGSNNIYQFTNGSAVTITLDSAYNIVNSLPMPLAQGQTFLFQIQATGATTIATPTLTDSTVTLSGTTSVVAAGQRYYQGTLTQATTTVGQQFTTGTTFTSLTQVGSTNLFTVVLGTNAITPTVGNLIYLSVSSGTLPSGWYPITKVNSATSIVIATGAGTVWTATAATVGTSTVAPTTVSPLITITGLYANATTTITV